MDMQRIADLIAAATRVRVGDVEGVIVSAKSGSVSRWLDIDVNGEVRRVDAAPITEIEPLDMDKVRAYHQAADAAARQSREA